MYNNSNNGDRWFFFPFLTGAVVGGAAVGLTRPRPIVNAYPAQPMQPMPYYPPQQPGYYYGYNAYSTPYPPIYR